MPRDVYFYLLCLTPIPADRLRRGSASRFEQTRRRLNKPLAPQILPRPPQHPAVLLRPFGKLNLFPRTSYRTRSMKKRPKAPLSLPSKRGTSRQIAHRPATTSADGTASAPSLLNAASYLLYRSLLPQKQYRLLRPQIFIWALTQHQKKECAI